MAVDDEGNIIVADSRNNRIQIFSSSGTFIKRFGRKGERPGELDTPQVSHLINVLYWIDYLLVAKASLEDY